MAREGDPNPKDPRFRRFRGAAYAAYLLVVGVFCAFLIRSGVRSLREMSPGKLPEQPALPVEECVGRARGLWESLDAERRALSEHSPVARVDERWTGFRTRWLTQYRVLEAQCALESNQRGELKGVFRLLQKTLDLYTTHAVQYAGEVGGTVDELRSALDKENARR